VRTRAALVPLFFESGTRFKILEAAALGTPVVSTSLGAEGLIMAHNAEIFVADLAPDFARRIVAVFEDREHSSLIAQNALDLVRTKYSLKVAAVQAEEVLSLLA
jgi:glycosyltransferase involved in cell wall biosynthesis